ncbi:ribosome hibernation-promoting factor, HPF/YfiA family [Kaarinaea lacus]
MQITINGHHVDLTEALRDYVNNKMERLERHFDQVTNINVILSVEKLVHKAEATVPVNGGNIFANAENQDMYAAIDALVDKLDRQILKRKEKVTNHHRNEGSIKKAQI